MSDSDHWDSCYEIHPACALAALRILQRRVAELESRQAPCGDMLTHEVVVPLHGEGPTWRHANDEPPCR